MAEVEVLLALFLPVLLFSADEKTLAELTGKSGYIFEGTVKQLHAATETVPREHTTAIVLVNQVLDGKNDIGNLTGKEVTVRLLPTEDFRKGTSRVFFTYAYSLGKSVGLAEVGSLPVSDMEALADQIRKIRNASADHALKDRLNTAVVVVVAVAGEPRPTEEALRKNINEHDPCGGWRRLK